MTKILIANNITKSYGDDDSKNKVLDKVNMYIEEGEFLSIMGPSGSGKSTLLYSISGMDTIDDGSVKLDGNIISNLYDEKIAQIRRDTMGFIFQNAGMLKNLSIIDNIMLPALNNRKESLSEVENRANKLLKSTGISELSDRDITKVSGGELQRASICRALINNPKIVFADEPTGALNSKTSADIINLLIEINKKGTTMMIVTHDANVASKSNRVLFMKDGKIVSEEILMGLDENERMDKVLIKMAELQI